MAARREINLSDLSAEVLAYDRIRGCYRVARAWDVLLREKQGATFRRCVYEPHPENLARGVAVRQFDSERGRVVWIRGDFRLELSDEASERLGK